MAATTSNPPVASVPAQTRAAPKPGWKSRRGLQVRVLVLVGIGMLLPLTIMGCATWLYLRSLGQQLFAERGMLAGSVAAHVDYVLQYDLERLQSLSSSPTVNFDDQSLESVRVAIAEAVVGARLFEGVFLVTTNGTWLSERAPGVGAGNERLGRMIREALTSGRPSVSPLLAGPGGVRRLYAFVPLRNWHGQIVAVAVGEMDPDGARFTQLVPPLRIGVNGSVDLLDTAGSVVASTERARRAFETGHGDLVRKVVKDRQASVDTRSCRQPAEGDETANEVIALAPLSAAPWAVNVRQAEEEAFGPYFVLDRNMLLLGSVLLGVALLFAWGVARSVRKPVDMLTRSAERIAGGNLEQPIPALPEDEIGRLGHSLEYMRVALKASMDEVERANAELEHRVRERTRELEELYRELQRREQLRGQLLAKVIGAQEDERKRLARELHDETSQTLNALVMRLETAVAAFPTEASRQRLIEARDLTVRTVDELHRLIYDLRPSVLDDLGLLSAIRWYAERHLEPLGVTVHWEVSGQERRLQPEVETALFRVLQEAITNIEKYAHAESVLIQSVLGDDFISIEIEDDGDGFDPASLPAQSGAKRGLGLMGMRERVELLGGTIVVDAAVGQGVRIAVTVPVKWQREETDVENPRADR